MKRLVALVTLVVGSLGVASTASAVPVEYVKVCSLYGVAYHYIPGSDICLNEVTGETREQTPGGTWESLLPTDNQGHWVSNPRWECGDGRLVRVGTFTPGEFKLNAFEKYQAPAFGLTLHHGEFISRVMMSGGFYDPLQPLARNPQSSRQQFCLRVADPGFSVIDMGSPPVHPAFCSAAPLACVSNSLIQGTPGAYSIPVSGAPVVRYNTDINGKAIGSPVTCGSQLVVTTGMGPYDPTTTSDPSQPGVAIPAAGTLSVWVCVEDR